MLVLYINNMDRLLLLSVHTYTLVVDFFLGIIRCFKPLLLSQIPFCSTLIGFGSVSHLIPFMLVHLERCVCLRLLTYLSFLFVCPCPYVLCVCVCVC